MEYRERVPIMCRHGLYTYSLVGYFWRMSCLFQNFLDLLRPSVEFEDLHVWTKQQQSSLEAIVPI